VRLMKLNLPISGSQESLIFDENVMKNCWSEMHQFEFADTIQYGYYRVHHGKVGILN
jgi:hypothetical protein